MYLYQEANTTFHLLHPVTKFLFLVLLITFPFFFSALPATAILFLTYFFLLLLACGSRNFRKFWRLLLLFWIFTFVIWVVIPRLRNAWWSYENAAMLATRIDAFVIAGLIFVTITRVEEFTLALTRLGVPYKGAFTLSLGFRLVPLFYQNLQTIVSAQKSRGVDLDSGSILQKAKRYVPIFGILISYSIRNADLMAMSLESKGFGYSPQRTSLLQPHFGVRDFLLLSLGMLVLVLLLFFRFRF
jgi:energy-coupling factor transport system permease protein